MKVFTVTHNAATKYVVSYDDDFIGEAVCFNDEPSVINFLNGKTNFKIYKNENGKYIIISRSGIHYLESFVYTNETIQSITWTTNSANAYEFNNINAVITGVRILHLNF